MRTELHLVALALAVGVASACAGDGGAPTAPSRATHPISLSFSTVAGVPGALGDLAPSVHASVLAPAPTAQLTIANGVDTLVVTRAQLVLAHVELMSSQGESCDDDSARGCEAIDRGTLLVDLPTDASVTAAATTGIPLGTYTGLEARLAPPQPGDPSGAALLAAHPELAGSSVRVEGTFRGAPFVYTGAVPARLELAFSPPLVVDATTANLTIGVGIDGWFRTSSGTLIDPSTALPGRVNEATVAANIARSFHAFRDDGRDGHDDHGADDGHGQGGGHDG